MQAADIFTKSFTNAPKWEAALRLLGVYQNNKSLVDPIENRCGFDESLAQAFDANGNSANASTAQSGGTTL